MLLQCHPTIWIPDHSADSEVKTAKDNVASVVLDEGQNLMTLVKLSDVLNIVVNFRILKALLRVIEDLCLHSDIYRCHLTTLIEMTLVEGYTKELLHFFVNARKENHVLCSIL